VKERKDIKEESETKIKVERELNLKYIILFQLLDGKRGVRDEIKRDGKRLLIDI